MVDSDYANNTDNRKSISLGLHTLGGTSVHWESKTQHVVTLSSTEAEYISLARGACENKFIMMLLDEGIRKPDEKRHMGKVYEDNLGAIYLVKNQHVGARTKHIDVRAHFIRELEDNGYLNVQFIRSEENAADILNKNCPEKLHTKHAKNIRDGTLDCWREDVEDSRLLDKSSTGETVNTVAGETKRDSKFRRNVRFESDVNSELNTRLNTEKEFEINRRTDFQRVQQPKIPSEDENYGKSMKNIKQVGEWTEVYYKRTGKNRTESQGRKRAGEGSGKTEQGTWRGV